MLRDYVNRSGKSIYALARDCGIPYSTLNDLVNGKVDVDNCKVSLIRSLAVYFGISMDEAYAVCAGEKLTVRNSYGVDVTVLVRGKSYIVEFEYGQKPVSIEACKVNDDTRFYINEIAAWRSEAYIREQRMKEFGGSL